MKTVLLLILGSFFSASVIAQKVTIRFDNNSTRNYEVKIDNKSYFSVNIAAQTNNQKILILDNLNVGSHSLAIYNADTEAGAETNKSPIYTNTFQLRDGYDMLIGIRRNGQVTFSEKQITGTTTTKGKTPMADAEFDKVLLSVKNKWSQSARLTAIKTTLTNKANYFSIEQVGQLMSLITAEGSRVELAKLSYSKVTDPDNFAEIYTLFNSEASRTEMENYVNSKNTGTIATNNNTDNGRTPMSNYNFTQLLQTVKNQYQQPGKVAVITDAFGTTGDYFATTQIRQLINLITAENDKLLLLKLSYPRVADQANFSSLHTLLTNQASRDDLNYFVKNGGITIQSGEYANRVAVSDAEFRKIQQKATLHIRQSSVVRDVKEAFSSTVNYYSIAQIRALLEMVGTETDRLALAKLAFHRVTEPNNYPQLYDLFTLESSKTDLSNYIISVVRNR